MSRNTQPVRLPLLEQLRGLIERSYDHQTAFLGSLAPFLLGDEGYRRIIERRQVVHSVDSGDAAPAGARLLVRTTAGGCLRVNLYYPDRLIRTLEQHDPARGLDHRNIDAFATFIEELDHLLLLAARAQGGPPLTLLEMELHANISKELVVRHFLARLGRTQHLGPAAVAWIRFHLFEKHRFSDPDRSIRCRYEDAARYAVRYLKHLEGLEPRHRLRSLRRFSRMNQRRKLRAIAAAA